MPLKKIEKAPVNLHSIKRGAYKSPLISFHRLIRLIAGFMGNMIDITISY